MQNVVLFSETQRFRQWWLWLIMLVVNAIALTAIYRQVILGRQFGNDDMSSTGLIIVGVVILAFTILFFNFRLDTEIRPDGIYYRFFPFHMAYRRVQWHELSKVHVRRYNAIAEYGGWGYRLGLLGWGRAFNVAGDMGLQLEFFNTKKLLIGTAKPEELTTALKKIGQLRH